MISDLVDSPLYWLVFFGCWLVGLLATRARQFDFNFVLLAVVSQYVAHIAVLYFTYGTLLEVLVFAVSFLVLYLISYHAAMAWPMPNIVLRSKDVRDMGRWWTQACKCYVIVYFGAKLATSPSWGGELDLAERLSAQNENRMLFFIGFAVFPSLVGCMHDWVVRASRRSWLDRAVMIVLVAGLLGSSSKGALLPLLLAYFGVVSAASLPSKGAGYVYGGLVVIASASVLVLLSMFPALDLTDVLYMMFYRVVANTDSMEYLHDTGLRPEDFPFAGPGALMPFAAKLFGYRFDYPAGVWLHGVRFGVWDGFGPNSGIVMDYYANLGLWGMLAGALLGGYTGLLRRLGGPIGLSFLSIGYLAVVDLLMFEVALCLCIGLLMLCLLAFAIQHSLLSRGSRGAHAESDRVRTALAPASASEGLA
ncbi:MAG: hypothetical protein RLZZ592_3036 [Pseudomonadota bacterium]